VIEARERFTTNLIDVLETAAGDLVLADANEEGAGMLALDIRRQLSTAALSLAAQGDRNVLQLF
jgi:flagellin-like hook-associated protein FlgL